MGEFISAPKLCNDKTGSIQNHCHAKSEQLRPRALSCKLKVFSNAFIKSKEEGPP